MSMPSSSEAVATSAFSSPCLSRCSASSRCSFARLPWCAATCSSPSRSRQLARHALGHAARVDEDQRGAMRLDQLARAGRRPPPTPRPTSPLRAASPAPRARDRARGGGRCRRSCSRRRRRCPKPLRPESARPPRSASASPTGRCAAAGRRTAPPGARARAPGARRACCGASAWISSTITVRVVASMRAARFRAEQDVERFRRGHEDVRRRRRMRSRSPAGVSPVRTQVRISTSGKPRALQRRADAGERRFEVALDVVRQRLERRDVDDLGLVREPVRERLAHQRVDGREEGRERLAGAGRAPRSARAGRPGSPARPAPAPPSARRSCGRTSRRRPDETGTLGSLAPKRMQMAPAAITAGRSRARSWPHRSAATPNMGLGPAESKCRRCSPAREGHGSLRVGKGAERRAHADCIDALVHHQRVDALGHFTHGNDRFHRHALRIDRGDGFDRGIGDVDGLAVGRERHPVRHRGDRAMSRAA